MSDGADRSGGTGAATAATAGNARVSTTSWAERAADRSPMVQRSRTRGVQQAKAIVTAARRLIAVKGSAFTTQELVKEAGVALQTFYRYFAGKDQLLLAVLEDMVAESCVEYEQQAQRLDDPVERIRFYVTTAVSPLGSHGPDTAGARFITTEHWRLQQRYPDELAQAIRPFTELLLRELDRAVEAGVLRPANPEYDAWLITQLVMAVYHHYAFATTDESGEEIGDHLWAFCLAALGGSAQPPDAWRRSSTRGARGGDTPR
jgi:AcrR family transcriptional regulator